MRQGARRDLYRNDRPPGPALTADHMAEAVVRAAMATGELSLLNYRDEAALRGHVAFRGRWVAFAALLSLHQDVAVEAIGRAHV